MTTTHTQPAGCDLDSQELGAIKEAAKFAWAYGKEELHATLEKIVARAAQAPQGDTRQGAPDAAASDYKCTRCAWTGPIAMAFEGAPICPDCNATATTAQVPLWDDNGEPLNEAAEQDDRKRAREIAIAPVVASQAVDVAPTCTPADERAAKDAAIGLWSEAGSELEKACNVLRSLSSYVGQGGCRDTENLDYDEMEARIKEGIDSIVRAAQGAGTAPVGLESVEGDLLPPVGSKVLIHLARQDAWVEHTVSGYYVWGALRHQVREGEKHAHRVFVRVKDANGYDNARLLSEVRLATHPAPVSTAAATTASASEPPKMSIDEAREYLVKFMEEHFTDKTYHRYIRGERDQNNLAGDFAWQMARALRMMEDRAPSRAADGQQGASRAALDVEPWRERVKKWQASGKGLVPSASLMQAEIDELRAALALAPLPAQADGQARDDSRDAARYRWLRARPVEPGHLPIHGDLWVVQYSQHQGQMPELRSAGFNIALDARIDDAIDRATQSRAQSDTTGDRDA